MLDLFIETADNTAWIPGTPAPIIRWFTRSTPKFTDLAILARGLLAGQVLRVVADSPLIKPALEAFCNEQLLRIVLTTSDVSCTRWHCHTHYYFDIERL